MVEMFLGIDLGGSHISGWLWDRNGKKHDPFSGIGITGSTLLPIELVSHLVKLIKDMEFMAQSYGGRIAAVGVASPGPLEPNIGVIISPPNLPHIKNLEVIKLLQERTGFKVFLVNDADAAVLGEAWLGSAKGFKNIVMLTLGTGIGSGVIVDGQLQRGKGMAAEWGHTTIRGTSDFGIKREDRLCSCGRFNCFEAFCGTEGLAKTYCDVFGVRRGDLSSEFVQEISKKMRKRDNPCWSNLFEIYCRDLAEGIINIINVHQPDCIILGGGIACDAIVEKVKKLLKTIYGCEYKLGILLRGIEIRMAGNFQSGIIGAAKHAMNEILS